MPDLNPYAAPHAPLTVATPAMGRQYVPGTVWRCGDLVVMLNGGWLPDKCIVTGETPLPERLACSLAHSPPWYHLWPLLAMYLTGAAGMRARVDLPVSRGVWWGRVGRYCLAIGLGALGFLAFVAGAALIEELGGIGLIVMGLGALAFLIAIVLGRQWVEPVAAHSIDANYIWLRGACPEFLVDLPEWPYAHLPE